MVWPPDTAQYGQSDHLSIINLSLVHQEVIGGSVLTSHGGKGLSYTIQDIGRATMDDVCATKTKSRVSCLLFCTVQGFKTLVFTLTTHQTRNTAQSRWKRPTSDIRRCQPIHCIFFRTAATVVCRCVLCNYIIILHICGSCVYGESERDEQQTHRRRGVDR